MRIEDRHAPPILLPDDAAPPVVAKSPRAGARVSTASSPSSAPDDAEDLNGQETQDLAEEIIGDIDEPLNAPEGLGELADALDGQTSEERSPDEQSNVDDAVEEITQEDVIGDLEVVVVDEDDDVIPPSEDAVLVGPPGDATLVIREGLTAQEVGAAVQDAAVTLVVEVAQQNGVNTDRRSILSFFREKVRPSILRVTQYRLASKTMKNESDEEQQDEIVRRAARDGLAHRFRVF